MVGHAGLYQALAMFAVAYFIIGMTVLSVCAIATNGALDAGGAYCILHPVGKFRVAAPWHRAAWVVGRPAVPLGSWFGVFGTFLDLRKI